MAKWRKDLYHFLRLLRLYLHSRTQGPKVSSLLCSEDNRHMSKVMWQSGEVVCVISCLCCGYIDNVEQGAQTFLVCYVRTITDTVMSKVVWQSGVVVCVISCICCGYICNVEQGA